MPVGVLKAFTLIPQDCAPPHLTSPLACSHPRQVRIVAGKAPKKGSPACGTSAPTAFLPFQAYAVDQRCLEARPWNTSVRRMLQEDSAAAAKNKAETESLEARESSTHRLLGQADSLDDCYRTCYSVGLQPFFYFAIASGQCYCCQTW